MQLIPLQKPFDQRSLIGTINSSFIISAFIKTNVSVNGIKKIRLETDGIPVAVIQHFITKLLIVVRREQASILGRVIV